MEKQSLSSIFASNPIIAAVKNNAGLQQACSNENIAVIFVLYGDICTIAAITEKIHDAGKKGFVHMDLIAGLSSKEISIDYIKANTKADGIISTKPSIIKKAKEVSLCTVFRLFMLDSMVFENLQKQYQSAMPDYVEILPGVIPKVIKKITTIIDCEIIAGGLISDKDDVMSALSAGAVAVSTSNPNVWEF